MTPSYSEMLQDEIRDLKDLGNLKYFLGSEVRRSRKEIFISQRKYIPDLLAETGMLDCKPTETPIID